MFRDVKPNISIAYPVNFHRQEFAYSYVFWIINYYNEVEFSNNNFGKVVHHSKINQRK